MNFQLKQYYSYSTSEIEEMLPYEREIVINLVLQDIEKRKTEQS
jgi:hypothetical protein